MRLGTGSWDEPPATYRATRLDSCPGGRSWLRLRAPLLGRSVDSTDKDAKDEKLREYVGPIRWPASAVDQVGASPVRCSLCPVDARQRRRHPVREPAAEWSSDWSLQQDPLDSPRASQRPTAPRDGPPVAPRVAFGPGGGRSELIARRDLSVDPRCSGSRLLASDARMGWQPCRDRPPISLDRVHNPLDSCAEGAGAVPSSLATGPAPKGDGNGAPY